MFRSNSERDQNTYNWHPWIISFLLYVTIIIIKLDVKVEDIHLPTTPIVVGPVFWIPALTASLVF